MWPLKECRGEKKSRIIGIFTETIDFQNCSTIFESAMAPQASWSTHHTQNREEQVNEVQVQGKRTKDRLVNAEPFHDLLSVVEDETRENEDREARDEEIHVGVEREEDLDKGCHDDTHESRE
jgi:hypothetical protein